jgi:hypothetical protein
MDSLVYSAKSAIRGTYHQYFVEWLARAENARGCGYRYRRLQLVVVTKVHPCASSSNDGGEVWSSSSFVVLKVLVIVVLQRWWTICGWREHFRWNWDARKDSSDENDVERCRTGPQWTYDVAVVVVGPVCFCWHLSLACLRCYYLVLV